MLFEDMMKQPYEWKVARSIELINCWYEAFGGMVYVSFSGGKDSTALLHMVRSMFPEVPAVFVDTGLEYPEIRKFVKKFENVEWIRPQRPFWKVIERFGYPIISKKVAIQLNRLQNASEKNKNVCRLYLTGYNSKGEYKQLWKLPKKWHYLIKAPFKISHYCCEEMKKKPFKKYNKKTGRYPIVGMTGGDSYFRKKNFIRDGCNTYDARNPQSNPLAFWTEDDIWEYIRRNDLEICNIYNKGLDRTGCMFCMFGVHMEETPNRFQLMKETHPKQWDYCMNKLELKEVLEYIGVPYE